MKILFKYIFILALFTTFFGCEKSTPVEQIGTPVFYASGTLNGEPFEWHAGEENLYMHSTYHHDTNAVYSFQGVLAPSDCETAECPNTLHFFLRDAGTSSSASEANAGQVLQPGNLNWRTLNDTALAGYRLKLSADEFFTGDQYNYSWTLSNGFTSTERYPDFTFPSDWEGAVTVCLEVDNTVTSCTDEICYDVYPANDCDLDFDYYVVNNVCFLFAEPSGGQAPYDYQWEVGQNHDPLSAQVKYEINSFTPSKRICITATDANGCVSQKCKNVIINPDVINCVSNFNHSKEPQFELSNEDFAQASIVWYNSNGEKFSSELDQQPDDAYFTIHEAEEYHQNINGEPTSKLKITFSCTLYNDDLSNQVEFENVEAIVAFAHP